MRNPWRNRGTMAGYENQPSLGLDRYDPCEIDPPEPLKVLARLGVLMMIALAFGLTAELLVRLPPH